MKYPLILILAALFVATSTWCVEQPRDAQRDLLTEVAVVSDGETWVTIREANPKEGTRGWSEKPQQYRGTKVWRLPAGEYEIIARRKGFADIKRMVSVRSSAPRMTIQAICDTPL